MIIDVKPTIMTASEHWSIIMRARGIDTLYKFVTSDGRDYSTHFDEKDFEDFQPKVKVSRYMNETIINFNRIIDLYETALKNNQHPTETSLKDGDTEETPRFLNKYDKQHFKLMIKRNKARLGKIEFIQINSN